MRVSGSPGSRPGGAVSWYAAAADPRLSVIVPVCGGAGSYAALLQNRQKTGYLPVEGLRKLEQEVKTAYAQRGAAERFAVHVTAGEHTYTEEMFEQVGQWFRRFLKRGA